MTTEGLGTEASVATVKADSDCAICRTDLGFLAFEKCSSDQEVSDLVFRLKCGHAFHNGCLCRALRGQDSCPTCRESKTEEVREFEFQVGSDGNIVITVPQDGEADGPINNFVTGIRDVMAVNVYIDRNSKVQAARSAANKAHRRYRAAEKSIMNRRCELIKDALQRLGHEKRDFFNKEKSMYLYKLKDLRLSEKEAAKRYIEDHPETESALDDVMSMIDESTSIKARADNQNTLGPLKTRFWTH